MDLVEKAENNQQYLILFKNVIGFSFDYLMLSTSFHTIFCYLGVQTTEGCREKQSNNFIEVEASGGEGAIVDGYEFTSGSSFLGSVAKD